MKHLFQWNDAVTQNDDFLLAQFFCVVIVQLLSASLPADSEDADDMMIERALHLAELMVSAIAETPFTKAA